MDGQLEAVSTPQGVSWYSYDDEGRLVTVSDPSGNSTRREYNAEGQVREMKVNNKTVATYTYLDGNLTQRTDAAGQPYSFTYTDGRLTRQEDPEGAFSEYDYDPQGRLWKTRDGSGNEIIREYGPLDGTQPTPPTGACTTCTGSTAAGTVPERLKKIQYPTYSKELFYNDDGQVREELYTLQNGETLSVTFTYENGRLKTVTNPDQTTVTYHYDLLGRKVQVDDPSGSTKFEYDLWDNLTALTDAKGQRTAFTYDANGRLETERRPMLEETLYQYDPQGRLWKITDPKLQTTTYGYDARGRLETIAYHDNRTVSLRYDRDGNLAGYRDCSGAQPCVSATYTYNPTGQKLTETVDYGPFTKNFSYTYYKNGQKQTFTAPDNTQYSYTYGFNNELLSVQIPGLGSIGFGGHVWNRPGSVTYPGGVTWAYSYDDLMRLKTLSVTAPGGAPLMHYQYGYNPAGNILTKQTEHGNYAYDYDLSSRLTVANNPMLTDETYSYDAVGNRLTASNATGTIAHNQNNELESYGNLSFVYDDNGNMVQQLEGGTLVRSFVYNAANRLIRVENGSGQTIATYAYDPFGRRLWKEVNGIRTYFFYSDEGLIAEYDGQGNELRSYGYKPDSTWTTDPLWLKLSLSGVEGDGQYYWYQNDHLGTPQKLTAQDGTVVWSAQYAAFGEATVSVETVTNNLRFPGQYFDAETGLHYNYHRFYGPRIGRFLKEDPIGFDGGDINLHGYAKNNPNNVFDPKGLRIYFQHPRELELIPGIMRANGLDKGAGVLEQWFNRPARRIINKPVDILTHKDSPNITMDWILSFPRAKALYDSIIAEKIYKNQAAKNWIIEEPERFGITSENPSEFGNFPLKFPDFHKHYINYRTLGSPLTDPFDDLTTALGRFGFYVVINKGIKHGDAIQKACLRVDEIAIYMRDSFDFEGAQMLGVWNPDTNYVGRADITKGTMVGNYDFNRYRNWYNKGGDFLIFSDIKIIKISPPEWIYLGIQ